MSEIPKRTKKCRYTVEVGQSGLIFKRILVLQMWQIESFIWTEDGNTHNLHINDDIDVLFERDLI